MTTSSRLTRIATASAGMLMFAGLVAAQAPSSDDMKTPTDVKQHMGKMKGSDHKFVTEAAQGGLAEVKLGQLAADKGSSADVKQFGQRMIEDHTKANGQLQSVASQKGMTLPSDIGSKNQAAYDSLSKLSGADFDRAYMKHMALDHKTDVAEFQKEANGGKDPEVKAFASSTLPTLQEHLKMAEDISGKLSGAGESADRMKKQ